MRSSGRGQAVGAREEAVYAGLVGIALALLLRLPVLRGLRSTVPEDLGDPLLQTWQLSWGAHALTSQPLNPWDSNTFWPLERSLAFSDALLGYAPIGVLFGDGVTAALARYNTLFLLAYALSFTGTYLLARQLGSSRLAGGAAGIAFAYAPWHFAQEGHLHVISAGGIPLALALLARGHGYGGPGPVRPGLVLAGWAVAAWQVTLGFALGLQLAYLLLGLGVVFGILLLRRRKELPLTRRLVAAELGGGALFAGVSLLFAWPYLQVAKDHPGAARTVGDLELFSPPWRSYLTAPEDSWLWGDLHAGLREGLPFPPEMTLAVGGSLVVLAVAGLVAGSWPLRRRVGVGLTVLVLLVLGTGVQGPFGGRFTYLPLFEHAPGFDGIRTPGRLVVPATLGLALLAAAGVDLARRVARSNAAASLVIGALAIGMVLVESLGTTPTPEAPPLPAALDRAEGPLLVLPSDGFRDNWAMYWSSAGLYPIVNGNSGFTPDALSQVRAEAASFPDAGSVELLRARGIEQVVLLPGYAGGSPWESAHLKPVDGLPVTRTEVGEAVVFDLTP
ncbi:MAG: hypothetical protein EPN99_00660 [Frankiales bacterium]|nr:MAG: hypothetical protein EPN99_00660 [Frankiales bacterium]